MSRDDEIEKPRADFVAYQRRRDARRFLQALAGDDLSALPIAVDSSKSMMQLALDALETGRVLLSETTSATPPTIEVVKRLTVDSLSKPVLIERFDVSVGLDETYMYLVAAGEGSIADRTSVFQVQGDIIASASPLFPIPNVFAEDLTALFQQQMMVSAVKRTCYHLSPPVAPMTPQDPSRRSIK